MPADPPKLREPYPGIANLPNGRAARQSGKADCALPKTSVRKPTASHEP